MNDYSKKSSLNIRHINSESLMKEGKITSQMNNTIKMRYELIDLLLDLRRILLCQRQQKELIEQKQSG